ncbi:hypothetical protein [Arhodomonas sp. SL1]
MSQAFWVFLAIAILVGGLGGFVRMARRPERPIAPQRREDHGDE